MDKDIRDKWVAALRSGKYAQTTEVLHCAGSFCCLGVLLDINGSGTWLDDVYQFNDFDKDCEGDLCAYGDDIGVTVQDQCNLVRMNDDEKRPFPEIADWIERNL